MTTAVRGNEQSLMSASFWQRLERTCPQPARTFTWPGLARDDFMVCERVRECVPEDDSPTFDRVQQRSEELKQLHDGGFGYSWRGGDDQRLSPSWLSVSSSAYDPRSRRFVLSAHPSHEFMGLPTAHDLGAIDARNGYSWAAEDHPEGMVDPSPHVYVGSTRTGIIVPLNFTDKVLSVDYHPGRELIGILEFLGDGSVGVLSTIDGSGSVRRLTVVHHISGAESVRFSPDGAWLLLLRWNKTVITEVATGRWCEFDLGMACWWPQRDATLLWLHNDEDRTIPRLFDLSSGDVIASLPPVHVPGPWPRDPLMLWDPVVSTDGKRMLVRGAVGVGQDHAELHGSGDRTICVDLESGQGDIVWAALLDQSGTMERASRHHAWASSTDSNAVTPAAVLEDRLQPADLDHEGLARDRWSSNAAQFVVGMLNHLVDQPDSDRAVTMMPEVVAAMVSASYDRDVWAQLFPWLDNIRRDPEILRRMEPRPSRAWEAYSTALIALSRDLPVDVDLVDCARAWSDLRTYSN